MDKKQLTERLEQALAEIPLSQEKIQRAIPGLLRGLKTIEKDLQPDSTYFNFRYKVESSAALLGLEKKAFVAAALKQLQLFFLKPETINQNVEQSAALLGVEKMTFVDACQDYPPLFCQSPDTTKKKADYIIEAHKKGYIRSESIIKDIMNRSVTLGYGTKNAHLRAIESHITGKKRGLSYFFTGPDRAAHTVIATVLDHYKKTYEETGLGLRAVQIMAEQGIIPALPDWAPAPDQPLRQRTRTPL